MRPDRSATELRRNILTLTQATDNGLQLSVILFQELIDILSASRIDIRFTIFDEVPDHHL
jgi:hypothetical protein